MTAARTVHVVVPDGITDPLRPSGGNTYDRRLCEALAQTGWDVHTRPVGGDGWPWPGARGLRALEAALAGIPDDGLVLVDGLLASTVPELLLPASHRVRLVILLHMPVGARRGDAGSARQERDALAAARAVVTTSGWTSRWVRSTYDLDAARLHVARPGVDHAPPVTGTGTGGRLLCVGAVLPAKGHDVLVAALASLRHLDWQCVCVGPATRDPAFAARVQQRLHASGLDDRVLLAGPRTGAALDASYSGSDLLVHPSRAETYGMVVTEALARGLPVVAAHAGGVTEALGSTADGRRPGILVPPGDVEALAAALGRWLTDQSTRADLRAAALQRRRELTGWAETAGHVARVLEEVAA